MAELLAPAGTVEALDAAIGEGADAVYLGLKSFNARLRSSNFAWNQFEAAVQAVHRQGKKIFVTVNTVVEEREMERMYRFLAYLEKIGPDGIIVQDFGIVRMVQEFFPKLRIHASTQMNIACARAVNLLSREGVRRVVLARELNLEEIALIKANTNVELEVFVHGALCVSESGLCLFSSFLGGKSANRGMCTQACRRLYEAECPGGTEQGYYFSPHDLQLIEKIPDLITAGVDSFKIEGRMKSAEYVGTVVSAYRHLIDNWQNDKKGSIETAKRILSTDFARAKTLFRFGGDSAEQFLNPKQAGGTGIYLGKIDRVKTVLGRPQAEALSAEDPVSAGNVSAEKNAARNQNEGSAVSPSVGEDRRFISLSGGTYLPDIGDSIRLHKKDDTGRESHKIRSVFEEEGSRWIDVPAGFSRGDEVYLLQTKAMSKRYPHVLPADLSRFRSQPGGAELPVLDLSPVGRDAPAYFPEGIYMQVSTVQDMFVLQSEKPVRVILELNAESKQSLLEKKEILPFSKKQILISLDPFCPQSLEAGLAETIETLVNDGFRTWVVNNPAHISMLRGLKANMIAGPYLYSFNRWAVSWIENQEIVPIISPLENSRGNLEETFEASQRKRVMITLFAYPALFRMRFKLPESYNFMYFSDKESMVFKALSTPDGSYVMPETPYSILERAKAIQASGFTRLLIDFSKTAIRKNDVKIIMSALYTGKALPGTSRFNWKDGFYSPERMEAWAASSAAAASSATPAGTRQFSRRPSSPRKPKKRS